MKGGVMQRSIDLGAASVVVRSPLREFNAQLDLLYRAGQIAEDVYETRRAKLKEQLAAIIRKEKRGKP